MISATPGAGFPATIVQVPTGLVGTLGVRIVTAASSTVLARTTSGIVEYPAGTGVYTASLVAPNTPGTYQVVWDTGGGAPVFAAEDLVVAVAVAVPTTVAVTLVNPVAITGDIQIVEGDDYNLSDGRALEWQDSGSGVAWPDLTGATIALKTTHRETHAGLTFAGSVVTPTGTGKKVRVELTAAQTTSLATGGHAYDVLATLSSSRVVTLVRGSAVVVTSP